MVTLTEKKHLEILKRHSALMEYILDNDEDFCDADYFADYKKTVREIRQYEPKYGTGYLGIIKDIEDELPWPEPDYYEERRDIKDMLNNPDF